MVRINYLRLFTLFVAVAAAVVATVPAWAASNDDQIGRQTQGPHAQIAGGYDVPDGKYPFMAAILDKTRGDSAGDQLICGGTLIYYDAVLTAAHCFEDGEFARDLQVAVGRTVLSSNQGELRNVNRIYMHPDHNPDTVENDVAVLKLDRRVNQPWILLVNRKDNRFERQGTSLRVAGWGYTNTEEGYPDRMKETQVSVLSDYFAEYIYGEGFFPAAMVAAGSEGKDTCQGDSGGPLFVKKTRHYYQVGITSIVLGEGGCGETFGAYTEVNNPSVRNFILSKMAG